MPTTNPFGSDVSRYIDGKDKQFGAVVFRKNRPILDSELNLISLMELENRAEQIRSMYPSGWVMSEMNPYSNYFTDKTYSNVFYFGNQVSNEVRSPMYAIVNGWVVPVTGTKTGQPPLAANDTDTWNKIMLNPPSTSTGGNRAEFVFLEVWLQEIESDPSGSVADGKPEAGKVYKFGNVEAGFTSLDDDLIDPAINIETTKRVQVQYRIRVVADVNLIDYPSGFDKTLVFAQGSLSAPSAVYFENMAETLGDPGLWRSGTGDPTTFGTVDGYVYAVPICTVFRRNSSEFLDSSNLAGGFNRNSIALSRDDATIFTATLALQSDITEYDASFSLTSIAGTELETITDFSRAYFTVDDEILKVDSIVKMSSTNYVLNVTRGVLGTTARVHNTGTAMVMYTARPDGLFSDQINIYDIMDMRHTIKGGFDYDTILRNNMLSIFSGNLRTTWKRFGSTNSAGTTILYGDMIADSSISIGGLSNLDGPNGNRRSFSDAATMERYNVPLTVPPDSLGSTSLTHVVAPFNITADLDAAGQVAGSRTVGGIDYWWNGDVIRIKKSDFEVGMPAADKDQVRFVTPDEYPYSVSITFEGLTTDLNSGVPQKTSDIDASQSATNPATTGTGAVSSTSDRILTHGHGITVSIDAATGDLMITLNSGASGTQLKEFDNALSGISPKNNIIAGSIKMHVQFTVMYGTGRGLTHKPKFIHRAYFKDTASITKTITRTGSSSYTKMIPTYLGNSPLAQTGVDKYLSETSEVMIDPGSKTVYAAPYKFTELYTLVCRNGNMLNWYGDPISYQGGMPQKSLDGALTVHSSTDPLNLFYDGNSDCRYVEVQMAYLPKPGLHRIPIVATSGTNFSSGINFLLMSKEGSPADSSDYNRNLVSYPSGPGYYIVTKTGAEVYGTSSGTVSIFGDKYTNSKLTSYFGGRFKGIKFPPFLAPARITGVYFRDPSTNPVVPASSPFDNSRTFVGGSGTDTNLLRDDFDGPTILLDVNDQGDLTFVLSADCIDESKLPTGYTFDNSNFLVECTLFGFDRGFLQTNGRLFVVTNSATSINPGELMDAAMGLIVPLPLDKNSSNNTLVVYYSKNAYQGDSYGRQDGYSDDYNRMGPLTISEQLAINGSPLEEVSNLDLNNKAGFEVLSSIGFVTSMGTGRLSGQNPLPILSTVSNPNDPPMYEGSCDDIQRRFSINRVGYEDWSTPKFPVLSASFSSRADIKTGCLSEAYDRDINTEFAGCTTNLPLGSYFRDKDFTGKMVYQARSSSGVGSIQMGTLTFVEPKASSIVNTDAQSSWDGIEFVCGNSSTVNGAGTDKIMTVSGTHNFSDTKNFKTTRGGAAWSVSEPWGGSDISVKLQKSKLNSESGSILAGMAYLVRSHTEDTSTVEKQHGHELQLIVVTHGTPGYFRDTMVEHSASGLNEGFTAVDRYRVLGRPLEKQIGTVDLSSTPSEKTQKVTNIWDDPILFGSSTPSIVSTVQETLPITVNGQTAFVITSTPVDPTSVQLFLNGVKLVYGSDYTVGGSLYRNITYTGSVSTLTTDILEAWYVKL